MGRVPIAPVWGFAEVGAYAALYVITVWFIAPHVATNLVALTLFILLLLLMLIGVLWLSPMVFHQDPPAVRGWGPRRAFIGTPGAAAQAWPHYVIPTALGAVALIAIALLRDPHVLSRIDWPSYGFRLIRYAIFGPLQALLIFSFLHTRLRTALADTSLLSAGAPQRLAVAIGTATVFSGLHAPNGPIMGMTFTAGLVWSWLFYTRPNVLLLGLSHAFLGATTQAVLHFSTRVGPFYDNPGTYVWRALVPGLTQLIGNRF